MAGVGSGAGGGVCAAGALCAQATEANPNQRAIAARFSSLLNCIIPLIRCAYFKAPCSDARWPLPICKRKIAGVLRFIKQFSFVEFSGESVAPVDLYQFPVSGLAD